MNKTINNIIDDFKSGKITAEHANKLLVEAGTGFSLNPEKNPDGGWTEAEMAEGFLPGEEKKPLPDKVDMGRNQALAGQVVRQNTKRGKFDVTYDADGYAVKAIRV